MSGNVRHVSWLQSHGLDEDVCAAAYEATGAPARSALKLCIARLHAFWGESPLASVTSFSYAQGFSVVRDTAPASYALVLCPVFHARPAQLLAACLPAILANVPMVVPCLIADNPQGALPDSANALLAAMDLAGLEQTLVVSEAEALEGMALLDRELGPGRVALLGSPGFGEAITLAAYRLGIPFFNGTAVLPGNRTPMLSVDAAHEGIWIWPDLGPDWFCSSRLAVSKQE